MKKLINLKKIEEKILILFFAMIIFSSIVLAYEENYIFIINEEGNTQIKYQIILSAMPTIYYFPSSGIVLPIPENSKNLSFYDSYGRVTPVFKENKEGYDYYYVATKKVESQYDFGYIYDLPEYTTVRYKENYHFEYPFYIEESENSEDNQPVGVYACIPSKASNYPVNYDSTPENDWRNPYTYETKINLPNLYLPKFNLFSYITIKTCPEDFNENKIGDFTYGDYKKIKFDFSIPGKTTEFFTHNGFTYNGETITLTAPKIYQNFIEKNIQIIEPVLSKINDELNLNTPDRYNLKFISDSDKIFEDNAMVSYDDGNVFYKVGIIRSDSDEFLQINLLNGIINSALLKTYTTSSDKNWWTEGALTNMALKIMKDSNLQYSEIQETINITKQKFKDLKKDEVTEFIESLEPEDRLIVDSSIVDEIDNICPNHVIQLNNITKGLSELDFSEEKIFDNYLIYNLKEFCPNDITSVLDKYRLPYDNVSFVLDKFKVMKDKLDPINIKKGKILELDEAKSKLEQVEYNLKRGTNIKESLALVNEIESTYENSIKNKVNILKEYSNAEQKADSIPIIFYLPSKIIAYNSLNKAIIDINKDNFDSAEKNINKSLFWINNSTILSLVLYIIICVVIWIIYNKHCHKKERHQHHYEH